jgi:hypothetical protein
MWMRVGVFVCHILTLSDIGEDAGFKIRDKEILFQNIKGEENRFFVKRTTSEGEG